MKLSRKDFSVSLTGKESDLGRQSLTNQITIKPISPHTVANMQKFYTSYWEFKSIVNAETYQSVIKWSNKSLFGSSIGIHVFYKTIAHKNTTSLSQQSQLPYCSHKYVQTSSTHYKDKKINLIREIIISISMIIFIKVIKETALCAMGVSPVNQLLKKKNHPAIHPPFQQKKTKSWVWKTQSHICAFDVAFRYESFYFLCQNAQIWLFPPKWLILVHRPGKTAS